MEKNQWGWVRRDNEQNSMKFIHYILPPHPTLMRKPSSLKGEMGGENQWEWMWWDNWFFPIISPSMLWGWGNNGEKLIAPPWGDIMGKKCFVSHCPTPPYPPSNKTGKNHWFSPIVPPHPTFVGEENEEKSMIFSQLSLPTQPHPTSMRQ